MNRKLRNHVETAFLRSQYWRQACARVGEKAANEEMRAWILSEIQANEKMRRAK